MKVVAVTCPHCGARLRVEATILYVRCEYCGTTARLQARTRMLERVVLPPGTQAFPGSTHEPRPMPQPPQMPPPQVPQMPRPPQMPPRAPAPSRVPVAGVIVALVGLSTAGGVAYFASMRAGAPVSASSPDGSGASGAPPKVKIERQWIHGTEALIADVDGDAVPDILGRTGDKPWNEAVRIVAIDGATGKPRWESEVIAGKSNHRAGRLVLDGELVLLVENHTLRAFATATGATRWSAKLDERIAKLCAGGGDRVLALGVDDAVRSLRRGDGVVVTNEPSRRPCEELPSDESRDRGPPADRNLQRKHRLSGASRFPAKPGPILAGARATGTPVATLVALDAKGAQRWRIAVSPDPLESDERYPQNVVIGEREVCCTYSQGLSNRTWHAACFALEDGRRIWDVEYRSPVGRLRIVGRTMIASTTEHLMSLDLDSGAPRWQF